ncbi:MAG: hypothetical protein IJ730_00260 [Alphaproteobacteria bacterium]|nr:hypothetical protein [Alphaproteobacteria bacterium]
MSTRDAVFGMFGGKEAIDHDLLSKNSGGINVPHGSAETPQYLIRSKDIFDSCIDGFDQDSAPCLHIEIGYAKKNTNDASGENSGDGRIVAKTPLVFMRNGTWVPKLLERMTLNKIIESIEILRIQPLEGAINVTRRQYYESCEIVYYKEGLQDMFCFAFSFLYMEYDQDVFDNEKHEKIGKIAYNYDFEVLKGELTK